MQQVASLLGRCSRWAEIGFATSSGWLGERRYLSRVVRTWLGFSVDAVATRPTLVPTCGWKCAMAFARR